MNKPALPVFPFLTKTVNALSLQNYYTKRLQLSSSACTRLIVFIFFMLPVFVAAQVEKKEIPDGTDGLVLTVPKVDTTTKKATNLPFNQFNTRITTIKVGFGYIGDIATFSQNETFKQQMDSGNLSFHYGYKTRDFRLLASGQFKTKRLLAWKVAYMYDGSNDNWLWRETGLTIGTPELFGNFFVGRTKEGYSMVKVMNGHSPWTAERQMALDVIPILADGIKHMGYHPGTRIFWNVGYYNDYFSKGQSFSTYEWQVDARVGRLLYYDKENNKVLHLGLNYRYGKPNNGSIALKSRPETNTAPQIINTGTFAADYSRHPGIELYYSTGRFLIGSEVMSHEFRSSTGESHNFFGGDAAVTYFFTKTKRPYQTATSTFGFVPVTHSVFKKGNWGEWEGVLRYSMLDLNDGSIQGGRFWRITPMINWYVNKVARIEFVYGYGMLHRYQQTGAVQFFQARLQLTLM
jgi:phosphate-selective porin OprO/OprP